MNIHQVKQPLVMTRRLEGMGSMPLKVLVGIKGEVTVAMDPVNARLGDWVFTIANSAARTAAGDAKLLTDLTVAGVIDDWRPDNTETANPNT